MAQAAAVGALLGASTAFLAPSAAPAPAPALRGAPHSSRDSTGPGLAGAAGVGAAALGLGLLAARPAATACRAAAVKKKGVKVVHGKEIPWNLFSPKAPYQGKVVENDVHPQTLTEPTGDANWETTHVTFDHGGKVPYIEGQSIGGLGFAVILFCPGFADRCFLLKCPIHISSRIDDGACCQLGLAHLSPSYFGSGTFRDGKDAVPLRCHRTWTRQEAWTKTFTELFLLT